MFSNFKILHYLLLILCVAVSINIAAKSSCDLRINGENQLISEDNQIDVIIKSNKTFFIEYGYLNSKYDVNRVRSHRLNITCLGTTTPQSRQMQTKNIISYLTFLQLNNCSDEFIKPINITLTSSSTIGYKSFAIDFKMNSLGNLTYDDANQSLLLHMDLEVILTQRSCFTSVNFKLKKSNGLNSLNNSEETFYTWFYGVYIEPLVLWLKQKIDLFYSFSAIDKFICLLVATILLFTIIFSIISCFRCCLISLRNNKKKRRSTKSFAQMNAINMNVIPEKD